MMPSRLFCDTCGAANQPQASFCRTCGRTLQSAGAPSRNTATGCLLANHLLKQRYRILDSVGKGGMGAVYRAEDTQLGDRKVAVKEMSQSGLSPQEITEASDAFKQEAHILARLQHPNLPHIYDHFSEAGHWYLVMSFIQGCTLADYLNSTNGRRLPIEEVLQIGIQLCTVLDYLHTQQPPIIFRDLKPSNIMRTKDGHIYLIDFGIARHFKPGQAKDTVAYGSMGYASPEQYGKTQTTPRSDIYSLGVVLHHLLSGYDPSSTPFRLPSLQLQGSTIPPELVLLITQMLEVEEGKRPTSISVVKQKLQSAAGVLGRQASPPTVSSTSSSRSPYPPITTSWMSQTQTSLSGNDRTTIYSHPNLFRNRAVLLIGLILLVLASSVGLFYVTHSNQAGGTITAATATLRAVNPNPYSYRVGTLVLNDPLTDNSRGYDWIDPSLFNNPDCYFAGNAYHAIGGTLGGAGSGSDCAATKTDFSNFAFEIQMKFVKGQVAGSSGGISFRDNIGLSTTNEGWYSFFIHMDGSYNLQVCLEGICTDLTSPSWVTDKAIHTGLNASNVIAVVANNNTFDLYVNGEHIAGPIMNGNHSGSVLTHGTIGANVMCVTPCEIVYNNAKVWSL